MSVSTWLLEDTQPTLRDYFAAAALHGLLSAGHGDGAPEYAYWLADAMLKARQVQ